MVDIKAHNLKLANKHWKEAGEKGINFNRRQFLLSKAAVEFVAAGKKAEAAKAYFIIGNETARDGKNNRNAIRAFEYALKLFSSRAKDEKKSIRGKLATLYRKEAEVSTKAKRYSEAIVYFKEAIKNYGYAGNKESAERLRKILVKVKKWHRDSPQEKKRRETVKKIKANVRKREEEAKKKRKGTPRNYGDPARNRGRPGKYL